MSEHRRNVSEHRRNVGSELVFLLKQRRNLYHQLKALTDEQRQMAGLSSPELLLKITSGRRKLVEKLRQLEEKLGLIKSNWPKISPQIGSEHKEQAREMLEQAEHIAGQITAGTFSGLQGELPTSELNRLDELLVE